MNDTIDAAAPLGWPIMVNNRREFRAGRVLRLAALVLAVSACAAIGSRGGISREPFADIPVPDTFVPFSNDWALIRSGRVTAARLVYQTALSMDDAASVIESSLKDNGWTVGGTEPVERAGFKGVALSFVKGRHTCRAEVVPSTTTTRVDLFVGRYKE